MKCEGLELEPASISCKHGEGSGCIPVTECGGGPRTLLPTTRYWWWMSCPLGRSPVESDASGGGGRLRFKVVTQPAGEGAGGNDGVGRASNYSMRPATSKAFVNKVPRDSSVLVLQASNPDILSSNCFIMSSNPWNC